MKVVSENKKSALISQNITPPGAITEVYTTKERSTMNSTLSNNPAVVIGIDLAKTHCDVVGYDKNQKIVLKLPRISKEKLLERLANMPRASVLMEACGGSHCFVRKVKALGHDGRLLNPGDVKRIRCGHQKNNMLDAAYIAWAWYIPGISYVAPKTQAQQDLQSLQRIYQGYMKSRIEFGNRIHALLLEYGLSSPQTSRFIAEQLPEFIETHTKDLTPLAGEALLMLRDSWLEASEWEKKAGQKYDELVRANEDSKRLMTIPGIGPKCAGALLTHCGEASRFRDSRQFAASLGLVPRQNSTGDRDTLGHITKRGPKHPRSMLVQGASALMIMADRLEGTLGEWVRKIKASGKKYGVKVCAIAAKLARIAWRILCEKGMEYRPQPIKAGRSRAAA